MHILEKPTVEHQVTFEDTDAPSDPERQRTTHDCLLGACEYIGPYDYDDILGKFGDAYTPGVGSKTKLALKRLYGEGNVDGGFAEVNPHKANQTWKSGGSVIVAQNRNHAIVLNKIDQYKFTYKYRRNNLQVKFKFHYMNPAIGRFSSTGFRSHYRYPTYYINK